MHPTGRRSDRLTTISKTANRILEGGLSPGLKRLVACRAFRLRKEPLSRPKDHRLNLLSFCPDRESFLRVDMTHLLFLLPIDDLESGFVVAVFSVRFSSDSSSKKTLFPTFTVLGS